MCLDERCTVRRGRPVLLARRALRTRRLRPSNCVTLPCMATLLLLAFLAVDVLALVANTLALVGLGRARGANVRGDLADLLLVDAGHRDDFLLGTGHLH